MTRARPKRSHYWILVTALGCGDAAGSAPPAAERMQLTDARRLEPVVTPLTAPQYPSLTDPEVRRTLLLKGYGDWDEVAGEDCVDRYAPAEEASAAAHGQRGKSAKRLLRFAFLTDVSLLDDESPARAVNVDQPNMFSSAYRPEETEICRMTNAMVKALNRVHAQTPLEFVMLGGNLIDNAQQNELDWALQILGGATRVECDSGEDNDLVPGVDDGKDSFAAPGLEMPFYWVTGNHDLLMQGALPPLGPYAAFALGNTPGPGFQLRDFSQPDGPPSAGPVPADPKRAFLTRPELMRRVLAHADGHGLSQAEADSGKAFYSFDIHDTPLRFVVLDTAAESGGAEGLLRRGDLEQYVRPLLDGARDDQKLVLLVSHHPVGGLSDGSSNNGNVQMDALTSKEWLSVLGEYPNILYSLTGHERADRLELLQPESGHALWSISSAPLGDYPHQARVLEVWDEDNGYLSMQAIYVDMDMRDDAVAEQGRHLGLMDYVSGWNPQFASGETSQRNVRIFAKKP